MDEPWSPLTYRLGRLHSSRLARMLRKSDAKKPPLRFRAPTPAPPPDTRALDAALSRIADRKEQREPRTRWRFTPAAGQTLRVTLPDGVCSDPACPKHKYAKVIDWGQGGVRTVSKDGYIDAAWSDVRPVGDAEMQRLARERAERDEHDQEAAAVRLSRFTIDDVEVGMRLEVEGPTPNETFAGKVVHIDRAGQYLVVRTVLIDGRQAVPGYVAARFDQIRQVPDPETGELTA